MSPQHIFRNRWWVVAASGSALTVGSGANIFSFSVFMKPISDDLSVGRGVLASAAAMVSFIGALASPFFGRMLDQWGIRRVLLPFVLLYAAAFAALSFLRPSLVLYLLFAIVGLTSAGQTPAAYSKAISGWFDKRRGLALGIAISGVGIGTAVIPQLSSYFITHFGWRGAYVGMGVTILALAFIPSAIFVKEPSKADGSANANTPQRKPAAGLTLSQAAGRSWRYWALTIAFLFVSIATNGTITHIVPLLTDRGLRLPEAVAALSGVGLAIIFGRILSGYCLDRFLGPYVAIAFVLCPIAGSAILYSGAATSIPIVATVLLGLATGAEYDMMAFFIGRYFGLRFFGVLYGLMFGISQVGNGLGVSIMGWSYQLLGSYRPGLMLAGILLTIACILFLPLGRYPFAPAHGPEPVSAPGGKLLSLK